MSTSDSQNVSGADYDDAVEQLSEETMIEMSSPEDTEITQRPRKTTDPESSSSSDSSSRSSSSDGSTSTSDTSTYDRELPADVARETPTRTIGDDHEASTSGRDREDTTSPTEEDPTAAVADSGFVFLNSESVERQECLLTTGEAAKIAARLNGQVQFDTRRSLGQIIERHQGKWIGMHYDSLLAPITFPFSALLTAFLGYYRVVPGQICPNAHRILACFPQICSRHNVACSMELFNFIYQVKTLAGKYGGGYLMIQSRADLCSIDNLPGNNRGWKNRIFSVKYDPWILPVDRVWGTHYRRQVRPVESRALRDATSRISSEIYEYTIFRSRESYDAARLPPPRYDLEEKYKPRPTGVLTAAAGEGLTLANPS